MTLSWYVRMLSLPHRYSRRKLLRMVVASAIAVALLAMLWVAGRLWWAALRGADAEGTPGIAVDQAATAQVDLAWDKIPDPNVVGYRIKYGTRPRTYQYSVTVGDQPAATLRNLKPTTRYYVVVVALDSLGNESSPSNEIDVLTRE